MTGDTGMERCAGWPAGGHVTPLGAEDGDAPHAPMWDEPDDGLHDRAQQRVNEETGQGVLYGARPAHDGDGAGGGDWDAVDDLDALGDL
jgi:hypothetical protein